MPTVDYCADSRVLRIIRKAVQIVVRIVEEYCITLFLVAFIVTFMVTRHYKFTDVEG